MVQMAVEPLALASRDTQKTKATEALPSPELSQADLRMCVL